MEFSTNFEWKSCETIFELSDVMPMVTIGSLCIYSFCLRRMCSVCVRSCVRSENFALYWSTWPCSIPRLVLECPLTAFTGKAKNQSFRCWAGGLCVFAAQHTKEKANYIIKAPDHEAANFFTWSSASWLRVCTCVCVGMRMRVYVPYMERDDLVHFQST